MIELRATDMAHRGEAVARLAGKAHFIGGVMPGETVLADVIEDRGSWARAVPVSVVTPSPHRVAPPCAVFDRCGGCTWQFADYASQIEWKRSIVAGQLSHLGGVAEPTVEATVAAPEPFRYRNRMDFAIAQGRAALHRRRSHDLVTIPECLLLRPELAEVFAALGDLSGVHKVTLRLGVATGERLVVVHGDLPDQALTWPVSSVIVRAARRTRAVSGRPWFREEVAGVSFRIPATGFFQVSTAGAEALVRVVTTEAGVGDGDVLLDGYAGVGLFAATVGEPAAEVVVVESSASAVAAGRKNLAGRIPGTTRFVHGRFEQVAAGTGRWDVAVIDPPRAGLGSAGIEAVVAGRPRRIVYVACDPASLARDTKLLAGRGYAFVQATPVDLFPQTYHIETVATFTAA